MQHILQAVSVPTAQFKLRMGQFYASVNSLWQAGPCCFSLAQSAASGVKSCCKLLLMGSWLKRPKLGVQDPAAEPKWSLSIRRSQLLNALDSSLSILSGVEDAWLAWRQASAQTEARLKHVLASTRHHFAVHEQVLSM